MPAVFAYGHIHSYAVFIFLGVFAVSILRKYLKTVFFWFHFNVPGFEVISFCLICGEPVAISAAPVIDIGIKVFKAFSIKYIC